MLNNIEHLGDRMTVHRGDVTDIHSARQALAELRDPNLATFHLAAQAHVGESWTRLDKRLRRTIDWYVEQRADADPCRQPVLPS